MTRSVIPVPSKGYCRKEPGRDNVARKTSTERTFGGRCWAQPEGGIGDLQDQLRLGSERTSVRIFKKAVLLEIVKRRVEPVRIRKISELDIVEASTPSEKKEE
jgi:hypothetical protein